MSKQSKNEPSTKYTCSRCGTAVDRYDGFTQDYCEDCKVKRANESEATEVNSEESNEENNGPSFIDQLMEKLPF